jgi:hypothetical protein
MKPKLRQYRQQVKKRDLFVMIYDRQSGPSKFYLVLNVLKSQGAKVRHPFCNRASGLFYQ